MSRRARTIDLLGDSRADQVTAWIDDLADVCEVEVDVVWRVGAVPHTGWPNGRATIVLPPSLRLRPEDHWRFTVAHEVGHVVARGEGADRQVVRRHLWRLAWAGLAIVGTAVGVGLWIPGAALLATSVAFLVAVLALRPAVRATYQPEEFAADAFAAAHGGVLTAGLAERRAAEERILVRVGRWWYPTHPGWPARWRAVEETFA